MAAPLNDQCSLPVGLREEITKDYPGSRIVSLADLNEQDSKLFQKDHGTRCPGLISVDFYGDGKPTLVFVLIAPEGSKDKAELVVAHRFNESWQIRLLDTATAAAPVVWREGRGKYRDVYGKKTIRATHPVIVFAEYEAWAILYAWTGKAVEKIWISD